MDLVWTEIHLDGGGVKSGVVWSLATIAGPVQTDEAATFVLGTVLVHRQVVTAAMFSEVTSPIKDIGTGNSPVPNTV